MGRSAVASAGQHGNGDKEMTKLRIGLAWPIALALGCMAAAQTSKPAPGPGTSHRDVATKPLTEKSATPAPRKAAAVAPASSRNNSAELARLEAQSAKSDAPKKSAPVAAKPIYPKAESAPAAKDSGINASYQKPRVAHK
jgi:hypothetical protein